MKEMGSKLCVGMGWDGRTRQDVMYPEAASR